MVKHWQRQQAFRKGSAGNSFLSACLLALLALAPAGAARADIQTGRSATRALADSSGRPKGPVIITPTQRDPLPRVIVKSPAAAAGGNALYLKTAFLLILCGYSCKVELFPLYTVGVDANFAAPAPASALISTGLVNAGFLALLRVYKLLAATEVFPWVKSVLLLVGVLSLVVGALFLRRTNNYKRFLSYSTVENMGIAAIGLGIGGIGVWAAVFHVVCHTLIKSSLFLQIAVVRQVYGNYRINRIGDYIHINRVGAVGLLTGMVVLVAFPPSPLFLSELMILKQTIADGRWWLVTGIMLLLCLVIYFFCSRLLRLCYQPRQDELHPSATDRALSWSALSLLAAAIGLGLWQPAFFRELIDRIASL